MRFAEFSVKVVRWWRKMFWHLKIFKWILEIQNIRLNDFHIFDDVRFSRENVCFILTNYPDNVTRRLQSIYLFKTLQNLFSKLKFSKLFSSPKTFSFLFKTKYSEKEKMVEREKKLSTSYFFPFFASLFFFFHGHGKPRKFMVPARVFALFIICFDFLYSLSRLLTQFCFSENVFSL